MSSLGEKIDAKKELLEAISTLSEPISEEQVFNLNRLFCIFNKNFILEKNENGTYKVDEIDLLYTRCFEIIKKEYSAKFMRHITTIHMFEE